jgi:hypothetical protein
MKRMWFQIVDESDRGLLKEELKGIGKLEEDPADSRRLILTFHNQSEGGMRMAGYRLSQEFMDYFRDFGMIREGE